MRLMSLHVELYAHMQFLRYPMLCCLKCPVVARFLCRARRARRGPRDAMDTDGYECWMPSAQQALDDFNEDLATMQALGRI